MSHAVEVNEDTFNAEIAGASCVLVDFWAEWCGPCKRLLPVIDELSKDYGSKLKVLKVNVDNNQKLAERFEVMSIPTLIVFKNGKPATTITGLLPKDTLKAKINPYL